MFPEKINMPANSSVTVIISHINATKDKQSIYFFGSKSVKNRVVIAGQQNTIST